METKKPFNETFVGKLLGEAKGILPEKGVLGVLRNLIDSDDTLTPEEKESAREHLQKLYEAEVADRDSARKREVGMAKYGKKDTMMNVTVLVGLLTFLFIAYVIAFMPVVAETKSFMRFEGMVEGVVISNIFSYYLGSSYKKDK